MSFRARPDLSLYLVVDPSLVGRRGVLETVSAAVAGGVTVVQYRDKTSSARAMVDAARALLTLLRPHGVPLVVNDRVDVALAAGADGVHVGQEDMTVADVRHVAGASMLVGLSITEPGQTGAVDAGAVDYLGAGPVFATGSKADAAPPLGVDGLRAVATGARGVPVVGIGGIDVANAATVVDAGAAGVAVISAICGAPDPERAARALASAVRKAGAHRAGTSGR